MSSKKNNSFIFALIMCVSVGFLLTFTATSLKDRQLLNSKIDKQKNILKALGLIDINKKYSNDEIITVYT
eukprot:COSAG01_NODE_24603_length_773_cov_1.215134_2_plen_69_part_01